MSQRLNAKMKSSRKMYFTFSGGDDGSSDVVVVVVVVKIVMKITDVTCSSEIITRKQLACSFYSLVLLFMLILVFGNVEGKS